MKKLFAILLCTALMAVLVIPAAAADISVNKAVMGIDGVRDDGYSGPIAIASVHQNADGTNSTNPATGQAWVAWDDGALYVYAEITDKTPNHSTDEGGGQDVDNLEIYMDWNNAKAAGLGALLVQGDDGSWSYGENPGTEAGYPYWQVRVPAGANIDGFQDLGGAMWSDMGWGGVAWESEAHEFFAGPLNGSYNNGYIVEIKINAPVALTEGKQINFDLSIGDNIEGTLRNGQVYTETAAWNDLQWATPNACMSNLTLAGVPAAAPAEEPAAPEQAQSGGEETGGGNEAAPAPEPAPAPPAAAANNNPKVGDEGTVILLAGVMLAAAVTFKKKAAAR